MKLFLICVLGVYMLEAAPPANNTQEEPKNDLFTQFEKMFEEKAAAKGGRDQLTHEDLNELYTKFRAMKDKAQNPTIHTQIVNKKKTKISLNPFSLAVGDNKVIHYEDDDVTL